MLGQRVINNILGNKPIMPKFDKKSRNNTMLEQGVSFAEPVDYFFKKVKGHSGLGYYMCKEPRELGSINSKYIGSSINDVYDYIERKRIETFEIL